MDPEYVNGTNNRQDGQDLIDMWKKQQKAKKLRAEYVWNKQQFDAVDPVTTDRLWGKFENKKYLFYF